MIRSARTEESDEQTQGNTMDWGLERGEWCEVEVGRSGDEGPEDSAMG